MTPLRPFSLHCAIQHISICWCAKLGRISHHFVTTPFRIQTTQYNICKTTEQRAVLGPRSTSHFVISKWCGTLNMICRFVGRMWYQSKCMFFSKSQSGPAQIMWHICEINATYMRMFAFVLHSVRICTSWWSYVYQIWFRDEYGRFNYLSDLPSCNLVA